MRQRETLLRQVTDDRLVKDRLNDQGGGLALQRVTWCLHLLFLKASVVRTRPSLGQYARDKRDSDTGYKARCIVCTQRAHIHASSPKPSDAIYYIPRLVRFSEATGATIIFSFSLYSSQRATF